MILKTNLQPLPSDHSIPFLQDWTFIHTPGHAPGHVSFFREKDRLIIAGDAIVTTKQESAYLCYCRKKSYQVLRNILPRIGRLLKIPLEN